METESLAVIANTSAHETTPGHTLSTADLMSSMTSKPRAEFLLAFAVFSPTKLEVSSKRIDPSHPYTCTINCAYIDKDVNVNIITFVN